MTDRPMLLVFAGRSVRTYREYLLSAISTRFRVHLLTGSEPTWERPYLTGWTELAGMADTVDAEEMCAAARKLAATEPVRGVFAWDEARVLQCAKVAAALELPGGDPEAAMRCRDKHLTRTALAAAGVPQPQWAEVGSVADGQAAAARIGYPVVLKPRAMAASFGVVRVDTPEQLAAEFAQVLEWPARVPGAWRYDTVLVEEYLPDEEVSADAAVHRGEVLPMFVARKELGYPPYFEEVGHVVDRADPLLADPQVRQILQDTHAALGFTDGMTHTELKLTPAGPKVIEVNARLGGDLVPYLGRQASGIDPGLAAAAVACGQPPELTADRSLVGAVRFFYVARDDTTIGAIHFDQSQLPAAIDRAEAVAQPGAVVSPPPKGTTFGRVAFATAVAATAGQCRAALDAAQTALVIEEA